MNRSSSPSNEPVSRRAPLLGRVLWSEFPHVIAHTARSDLSTPARLVVPYRSVLSHDRASRLHPRFLDNPCIRAVLYDPDGRMLRDRDTRLARSCSSHPT